MTRIRLPFPPPIPSLALGTTLWLVTAIALPASASAVPAWPYARPLGWVAGDRSGAPDASPWNRIVPEAAWSDPATGALATMEAPGMRIYLDPVTRRPTAPTAEQQRSIPSLAPAAPDDRPLPVERIPGGGEMIHLDGRYTAYEIARRDASGRFTTTCAPDSASAVKLLAKPAPRERHWEEK